MNEHFTKIRNRDQFTSYTDDMNELELAKRSKYSLCLIIMGMNNSVSKLKYSNCPEWTFLKIQIDNIKYFYYQFGSICLAALG